MADPLSPDEGVRAALIPVVWETHPLAYNHIRAKTGLGTYLIVGRNDGTAIWGTSESKRLGNEAASIDDAKAQAEADYETRATACFAALSTSVRVEPAAEREAEYAERIAAIKAEVGDDQTDPAAVLAFIERWTPDTFPVDENGQVHMGRAMLEMAADAIRAVLSPSAISNHSKD